jgi:L-amino acid N-acyltransferase YncA
MRLGIFGRGRVWEWRGCDGSWGSGGGIRCFSGGCYVVREGRGSGVGRALMGHRIEMARGMEGVRMCSLQMTTTNEAARRLHRAAGFVGCGVEREAMCVGGVFYDFELMQLALNRG